MSRTRFALLAGALLLATPATALADFEDEPLSFDLDGYWRVRALHIGNLYLNQGDFSDVGREITDESGGRVRGLDNTAFLTHQMRLSPTIAFRKIATLRLDVDILDGVVWGDNAAEASLPLFAANPSSTGVDGEQLETIAIRRAWLELQLPVGQLRVGRMPSNWGMGLLANKGDGLDADFGEFEAGSTVDRILFATKPVVIAMTVMGTARPEKTWGNNIILALAYDKIVDLAQKDDEVNPEQVCLLCAPQILLSRPNDDVDQVVGVLAYRDESAEIVSDHDVVVAGMYAVHRVQKDTNSKVWILDWHAKLRLDFGGMLDFGIESEMLMITGTTEAIDSGIDKKSIDIKGGVVRPGWYPFDWLDVELEFGWAPGDTEPTDDTFSTFPFHPDYNVGLLLYDYVIASKTARAWGAEQRGLWSRGGVWNSIYVYPKIRWRPDFIEGLTVTGAFLWAKAETDTNAIWFATAEPSGDDLTLGYEFDLAVRYDFYGYVHAKLETGVMIPGRALHKDVFPPSPGPSGASIDDRTHDGQITSEDAARPAWTVQARIGFEL